MWALAGERQMTSFDGRTGAARREILGVIGPSLCVAVEGPSVPFLGHLAQQGQTKEDLTEIEKRARERSEPIRQAADLLVRRPGGHRMTVPVWSYLCPACGRPAVIRSEPDQPLPASVLGGDADVHDLLDFEAECSVCALRVLWEVSALEIRFTSAFDLKVPKLS